MHDPLDRLDGRVAVIAGGAGAIGLATAQRLADLQAKNRGFTQLATARHVMKAAQAVLDLRGKLGEPPRKLTDLSKYVDDRYWRTAMGLQRSSRRRRMQRFPLPWALSLFIAALLAACDLTPKPQAGGPAIEIGGVWLGMPMADYRNIASTAPGFRIAGVTGSSPKATFVDDRLATFQWEFPTRAYPTVRQGVRVRYPAMEFRFQVNMEVCTVGPTFVLTQGALGGANGTVALRR